jgi:F5/8 type C domain
MMLGVRGRGSGVGCWVAIVVVAASVSSAAQTQRSRPTPRADSEFDFTTEAQRTQRVSVLSVPLWLIQQSIAERQPTPDPRPATPLTIDDFESGTSAWTPRPSEGVDLRIAQDAGVHGKAMRLDFDFRGHAGYAIARRAVDLDLPPNYELTWQMRADAPVNNLELKLIDATGDNVWWLNRRDFVFPHDWKRLVTRKRQIAFAWGPAGGGEIRHVAAIEIVVTAGTGRKGSVWIDDLTLESLPPEETTATKFGAWRKEESEPTFVADLGHVREIGGLRIDWDADDFARDFAIDVSRDGQHYETVRAVKGNGGAEELIWLPEIDARFIRLVMQRSSRGRGWAAGGMEIEPAAWAATVNDFFARVAERSRRGDYPRYLAGEQPYWTIVGADRGEEEALAGEDGSVEPFKRGFSIEPFLRAGDHVIGWADASIDHSLARGDLPIVTSTWTVTIGGERSKRVAASAASGRMRGVSLATTTFVSSDGTLYIRYRVTSAKATKATFYLAVRPFQVNPTTQFLNTPGGTSPIRELRWNDGALVVNGTARVVPLTPPRRVGASTFDEGNIVGAFRRGEPGVNAVRVQSDTAALLARDDFGYATAALEYPLNLDANGSKDVVIAVPLQARDQSPARHSPLATRFPNALARAKRDWSKRLDRVAIDIPAAPEIANTLRSNIAWILINADGPRLQPGSRSYERSWIRDGALIASVLLRLGHADIAKQFAEWFATYQFPDGKVPCCVDARGADPVPENDSHGELIFLVAEIWRYTDDVAFVRRMWPHVDAAAQSIEKLRSENHGDFAGLLTESISHEGYSAKPMHSYWDDFFGVRGLEDAAELARMLKMSDRERQLRVEAASFRRDLSASIVRSMESHHIDFVPGSAELGDFDATSTAIAVSPLELTSLVPQAALARTFARYLEEFRARRDGAAKWDVYTPYELRNVGAFVRMGRRAEANELLEFFMRDRRPAAWNEWAEVVPRQPRSPHFLGDMPHSWVGSDFMRSVLDFFAFDREDGVLVVGAGVPERWVNGSSVHVGPLATYTGAIDLRIRGEREHVVVDVTGTAHPRSGMAVRSPYDRGPRRVTVNGVAVASEREVSVRALPARVVFEY